jgi:nucleoside-diphosphate-sugar epimerase
VNFEASSQHNVQLSGSARRPTCIKALCEQSKCAIAAGMDTIFHCATAAPAAENLGNQRIMQDVNVKGTENILNAAIQEGVRKVVYTSTASVVFDGKDLIGVDESAPYVEKPLDYYTGTKVRGTCRQNHSSFSIYQCKDYASQWSSLQPLCQAGHNS